MKKYILCFLGTMFLMGCSSSTNIISLDATTVLTESQCSERGLTDKVVMIHSKYCPYCVETLPDFLTAAKEVEVSPVVLDIAEPDQQAVMMNLGINVAGTPTFLFACDVVVGKQSLEEYRTLFQNFREKNKK